MARITGNRSNSRPKISPMRSGSRIRTESVSALRIHPLHREGLGHSSHENNHTDDQHTALGRTLLPQTINTLLKTTFHGERTPPPDKRRAIIEILRVGANLCVDHGTS